MSDNADAEVDVVSAESSPGPNQRERISQLAGRGRLRAVSGTPSLQRGVVGVIVGLTLILWPNLALNVAVAVAGAGFLISSSLAAYRSVRQRDRSVLARSVLDAILGAGLVVISSISAGLITLALAVILAVRGLADLVTALRTGTPGPWYALRAFAQLSAAAAVAILGEGIVLIVLLAIGISWLVSGAVTIALSVGPGVGGLGHGPDDRSQPVAANDVIIAWFRAQDVGAAARKDIVDSLIFEGDDFTRRVARFAALMAFATGIAALGVQTDSTAVVIGAMLVAPLMTPIMATSLSLVMGSPTRAIRSLTLVATGVGIAIGLAFLIGRFAPGVVEIGVNTQIASRTAPTLLDLLIALAAGGAGGYAISRPDVSDSLPGVAIAVALVPPLAVVGITLSAGQYALAAGAFLLFLTNLVGIILASGVVFAATGVAPWSELAGNMAQLRRTSITVLVALLIISIPLALTGERILANATKQNAAASTTQIWLDERVTEDANTSTVAGSETGLPRLQIVQVNVDGRVVEVILIGDGRIDEPKDLADRLAVELGHPVSVELRIIPERRVNVDSGQ